MTDELQTPDGVHPRFLNRLAETLSSRLQDIETLRHKARDLMTGMRDRLDYLEKTFGLPLDDCRRECDIVLRRIEAIGEPSLPTAEEIEALVQQVIRLSAMISTIGSAGFGRRSRDDGHGGAG